MRWRGRTLPCKQFRLGLAPFSGPHFGPHYNNSFSLTRLAVSVLVHACLGLVLTRAYIQWDITKG